MRISHLLFSIALSICLINAIAMASAPMSRIDPYLMLPQPMHADELHGFARILHLSEAQETHAASLYSAYSESLRAIGPRIEELSRREHARRSQGVIRRGERVEETPRPTAHERYEELKRLLDQSRRIGSEIIAIDDHFFNELAVVLSETQLENLHRAQQSRKRLRYQVRTEALPGAQVDLVTMMKSLDISPVDDSFESVLSVYEDQLVQLLELRHAAQRRVHLNDTKWLADHFGQGGISQEAIKARGRIRSSQMRLESSLRRLNVSTLEALSIIVSQADAVRLFDTFEEIAHPTWSFYDIPDPKAPRDAHAERTRQLLDDALSREGMDEDVASEIDYLREHFYTNYRRIQRRLSDADFNFREHVDRTMSAHPDDIAAHEAEIASLLHERQRLCERSEQRVRELLEIQESQDSTDEERR